MRPAEPPVFSPIPLLKWFKTMPPLNQMISPGPELPLLILRPDQSLFVWAEGKKLRYQYVIPGGPLSPLNQIERFRCVRTGTHWSDGPVLRFVVPFCSGFAAGFAAFVFLHLLNVASGR